MSITSMGARLAPLIGEIDGRKLGICPECDAGPIWRGLFEFADHVQSCVRISIGRARTRELATLVAST